MGYCSKIGSLSPPQAKQFGPLTCPTRVVLAQEKIAIDLCGFRSLKNAYTAVDGEPEIACKLLKRLVGERGFEPPTPLVPNQISIPIENLLNLVASN